MSTLRRNRLRSRATAVLASAVLAAGLVAVPLAAPPAVQAASHVIRGRITASGGTGVQVMVTARSGPYSAVSATSAVDGTFGVAVPAGRWIVSVNDPMKTYPPGYWSPTGFTPAEANAQAVVVGGADVGGIDIAVPQGLFISGTLTDATAAPKSGVSVTAADVRPTGERLTAKSAADGTFRVGPLAPATYTVEIGSGYWSAGGYTVSVDAATPITLTTADRTGVTATMPTTYGIGGRVEYPDGSWADGTETCLNEFPSHGVEANCDTVYTDMARFGWAVEPGTYSIGVPPHCEDHGPVYYYQAPGLVPDASDATGIVVADANVSLVIRCLPGQAALRITGQVTDGSGAGVRGVSVEAGGIVATSSASGYYEIAWLQPGMYSLHVFDLQRRFRPGWYSPTGLVDDEASATPITLSTASPSIPLGVSPGLYAAGRVTDAAGNGVANVALATDAGPGCPRSEFVNYVPPKTDVNGNYTIGGLSSACSTRVFLPAYDGYYSIAGFQPSKDHASPVSLKDGSLTGIDIQLPAKRTISGVLRGPTGQPFAGQQVSALSATSGCLSAGHGSGCLEASATTAADGSFKLAVPGPYSYGLYAETSAGSGYYAANGLVQDSAQAVLVDVSTGNRNVSVAVGSGFHTLRGAVLQSNGRVAEGKLTIRVRGTDGLTVRELAVSDGTLGGTPSAQRADAYSLAGLPSGSYTIEVEAASVSNAYAGGFWDGSRLVADSAKAVPVSITADRTLDLVLPSAVFVRGRATRADGLPAQAHVQAVAAPPAGPATSVGPSYASEPGGEYGLPVAAGDYLLRFAAEGYVSGYYAAGGFTTDAAAATKVTVGASDVRGISVKMPVAADISGAIRRADGSGVVHEVYLVPTGVAFDPRDTKALAALPHVLANGTFRFGGVQPGTYQLWTGCPTCPTPRSLADADSGCGTCSCASLQSGWYAHGAPGEFSLDRASATVIDASVPAAGITVTLPETRTIAGTVRTSAGTGLASVWVEAIDPTSGEVLGATATGASGTYRIDALSSRSYAVRVRDAADGYGTAYYDGTAGSTRARSAATAVSLSAGSRSGIELSLGVVIERYAGATRFATAAATSRLTFTDPSAVDAVYIANATSFADALTGAAAAGTVHGPVLLANATGPLDAATTAELTRLHPKRIIVLGGTGAIGADVVRSLAAYAPSVARYAGATRFATAAQVSKMTFVGPGSAAAVYIANAYNFPDALAGAAAAGTVRGPVLLASPTGPLDASTIAELNRLRPQKIVVLGGTGAISSDVLGALKRYSSTVTRYSGSNRFATAAAVSKKTFTSPAAADVVYVANAYNFPDALAGAAAAGTIHGPVLLASATGALDAATIAELQRLRPRKIVVLGGDGAISAEVFWALEAYIS